MKLFKERRAGNLTGRQVALAGRIAKCITAGQRRVANWLNGKTAGLSAGAWLFWLVLFSLGFGAYCLYLLVAAFN